MSGRDSNVMVFEPGSPCDKCDTCKHIEQGKARQGKRRHVE